MADPLSICAIIGIALVGRSISLNKTQAVATATHKRPGSAPPPARGVGGYLQAPKDFLLSQNEFFDNGKGNKQIPPTSFADIMPSNYINGAPVVDTRSRTYNSKIMNNLSSVPKELVGPGLGVGPDIASTGGFQQLYRVLPTNVGAYKLTTLPGRTGPAADISGGRGALIGQVNHKIPEKTAFMPSRRPNVGGQAQGIGGALIPRAEYEKTKQTTNRAETSFRADGLSFAPAKRFTTELTVGDNPTRNKGDSSTTSFHHVNNPAPGIHSFESGYTNTPIVKMMEAGGGGGGGVYTDQQLMQAGLRPEDRRSKTARPGNAGRMNVRAGPLNQNGMITVVRSDTNKYDGRTNPANGGWTQNYTNDQQYQFNAYKGNENPRTRCTDLGVARTQLQNNPFNHPLS